MKKTIFSVAAGAMMTAAVFTSCNSPEKEVEDARAEVADAKQDLKAAVKDSTVASMEKINEAEWTAFKEMAELKIKSGEIRIAELKKKIKIAGEKTERLYSTKIDSLEQRNKNLQVRIDTYEKNQSDWESFKREFNNDMDNVGHSLKNFVISTKN